jgi:transcriptional regulator with XRE-family HTH domain
MAKETRQRVPAGSHLRGTPRALSQTLRQLREGGEGRTFEEMAEALAMSVGKLRKLERSGPDYQITYKSLQRYQDFLGIPVSVIVLIFQIVAAARDKNSKKLEVLSTMLERLAGQIATDAKRNAAIDQITRTGTTQKYRDWDRLLNTLFAVTINRLRLDPYKNAARLATHKAVMEKKRNKPKMPGEAEANGEKDNV